MSRFFNKLSGLRVGSQKVSRIVQTGVAGIVGVVLGFVQFLIVMGILMALTDAGDTVQEVRTTRGDTFSYSETVQYTQQPEGIGMVIMVISVLAIFIIPIYFAVSYWVRSGHASQPAPAPA